MAVFHAEHCATNRAPGRLLRRLDRTMSAVITARFDDLDLSYFQWIALKVVMDGVVGTAGELARELGITAGATTRLVDVLEARGLIARERGDEDRRVVRLAVTLAGGEAVSELLGRAADAWNELFADFTQAEAERTVAVLDRLVGTAERMWSAAAAGGAVLRPVTATAEAAA